MTSIARRTGAILAATALSAGALAQSPGFHRGADWSDEAAPPYSASVVHGDTIYLAGTLGFEPGTRTVADGIEEQTRLALGSIAANLALHGAGLADVLQCDVFLEDIDEYGAFNAVYSTFFPENPPARMTAGVDELPLGASVEISCIAALPAAG